MFDKGNIIPTGISFVAGEVGVAYLFIRSGIFISHVNKRAPAPQSSASSIPS